MPENGSNFKLMSKNTRLVIDWMTDWWMSKLISIENISPYGLAL